LGKYLHFKNIVLKHQHSRNKSLKALMPLEGDLGFTGVTVVFWGFLAVHGMGKRKHFYTLNAVIGLLMITNKRRIAKEHKELTKD